MESALTNPQKSIYFTEEYYKGTNINNIAGIMSINQEVDFDKFILAIKQFVKQNDSCRILLNEELKQQVCNYEDFPIEIIDVNSKDELFSIANEIASQPFALYNSYLFKFVVFRFPNNYGGFIVNMHHLIADSWTLGITVNEINEIYSAYLKNEEYEEKDVNLYSYKNYIASEQEYINSSKYEKDKEYWEQIFATVPDNATIPSINSNSEDSTKALRKQLSISSSLLENIKKYCETQKVSLFNFLTAVFSLYIGRVSNLDDFCIGTPILNRSNFKEKNMTGMFINTLPLRVNIDSTLFFNDFLNFIMASSMSLLRHQKYSYQNILEDLRKKQNNLPSLYKIMVSYQITKMNEEQDSIPHDSTWLFNGNMADDIDIHIFDLNDTNELNIAYDYKCAKYTAKDMEQIHSRILHIISQILSNENLKLSDIEIVTPEEKEKLIYGFNQTKLDYPKDKTIAELFEEQVKLTPDNVAVVFEDKSLTYKELNEKANSLAYYLREKNIKNNNIVGVMVNRSLEMIIAILAVLKSGGAYIPIDPDYPSERIDYVLENSNCSIVLTQSNLINKINSNCEKIDISLENKSIYSLPKDDLNNISKPHDLSYLIYTSGSTGKPKGVMLTQKALVNLAYYCNEVIPYLKNREYISIVSVTTVSFDIFIFETLISLQRGLKLVIANNNEQTIPYALNNLIKKENIQVIQTTPSRMQLFYNHINDIPHLSNLKYIILAGEPLPINLKNNLLELTHGKIFNGYGPSETTVFSTLTDVTNQKEITIGKPLANTQIYILDKNLQPCPIGVAGEIYISGDGVGLGYMQNPNLTKQSFIPNIFVPNTIMYKTGDIGFYKENGEIICLGRIDHQVKIRGLRIELEEIENVMAKYSGISNCVVVKKVSSDDHEFLCAYYTANEIINENELRNILKSKLPNYMVPQYFVKLETLPYTPNGKIDKKSLPEINFNEIKINKEIIKPRNEIDSILISLLSELLKIKDISIDDSFYDLGGDSLCAIQLCSMVYHKLNTQISVKDILSFPIIMNLSDFIYNKLNTKIPSFIKSTKEKEFYPTSSAQKRIFFASQADENSTLYNIAGGLLLDKVPNSEKLENCLNELISRHTSLRTYFDFVDDELVQKIIPNFHFSLQVENADWNNKDNIIKDFIKPFNLLQAPLFRAKLIVFENSKAMLLIDLHHSISDGTSLSIFVKELCALYNDEILEPNEINYKDFAVWENNYFKSNTYKEDKNYWLEKFNPEPPILDMPCTMQRPARQSFEGASYHFSFDKNQVLDIAKSESITPYMLLLAAYFILLYKYTGSDDIVIGTPIMNREKHNLENVLGMFVNNLALRTKIDASKNIKEFLQEVKNSCLEDFSHQNYPFNNLIKDLGIKRDISRNPIFDTMFIYQNNGYSPTKLGDINASYIIPDLNISKFDLSLEVIPTSSSFELRFEYCTKLFTKEYIEKMATHYKNILDYLTNNLHSSIAEVNMLSKEEENKILNEFNNTYMPYNKLFPLVSLFEKQVEAFPNKTAIIFEDSHITYSSLNEKVNSLAHVLIEKYHIQKNAVVGILLKRSIETVVSMLAVLKAGATYLLIDEALPFDRIIFMLENSKSPLLITDYELKNIDFKHKLMLSDVDFEKYSKTNPNVNCSNDDGFCVIYTSGSTGTPKGVLLKRVGVLNLLFNHQKLMDTNKCENFLSISAISFDMFIVENFVALLSGKTVILSNEEQQKIPLYTAELIKKYKADFILTTPTRMNLLLEVPDALGSLKVIQLGGEVFSPELYAKLKSMTNANIYNGYGPSEATACSACKFITSNDITIGRPFYNVQIYICDNDLNLRPIGFPGEICISGDGVGCGYVNNNELTEKSFVKNPFGSGVLYKTGDLAYYNENGEIEYIGRKDFQIKIRGLRVELSEIEKQMLKLPNIKNVAVLYNSNAGYISAFYTSSCDEDVTSMRNELAKKLPLYMVPKYFIKLDELPVTTNGKVNKKLLQNYSIDTKKGDNNYVPPQTERQKLFCDVWSKLLDTQIGIEDNVFECGADSLIAIKFKTELLSYKINIPYANIFDYPTVKELAENSSQVIKQKNSFDYSNINKILDKNSMQYIGNITKNDNNNILLLGSNGFVGAHILYSFIKNDKGTAYCIVRNKKGEDAYNRLINTLHFYFGTELDNYINNRIIIYTGNVLEENLGLGNNEFNNVINNISTIVNAAAIVKHYGDEKKFEEINVNLVRKASEICEKFNKRFIHISTTSVCGDSKLDTVFSEKNLYIGQDLDNVYIKTKFEAERLVLEKVANGLKAQILRLGNITNRFSDGMFQINADSNAFINRLKTFIELACMPRSFMKMPLEFTPVDLCANSIIAILQNNIPNVCVLHLYNDKLVNMEDLVSVLRSNGFDLKVVDDKEFENIVQETLSSDNKEVLSGIVVDMNKSTNINYLSPFKLNSEFSKAVLSVLGFSWNNIDSKYLQKYIKYLKQIKFI